MDHGLHDQAECIHEQIPFAPREFLRPVVALRATTLGGLDRLTIENRRAERRQSPSLLAHPFPQDGADALPDPSEALRAKVRIHGGTTDRIRAAADATETRCAAHNRCR
jgi:hypothetical protein